MEAGFEPRRTGSNPGLFTVPPSGTAPTFSLASAELCKITVISHTCFLPASQIRRGKLQILRLVSEMLSAINASVHIYKGQADYVSEQIRQKFKN